jgi:hypothetical protein
MQVVFFITRIMYLPEQLAHRGVTVLKLNPFASLLEIVRDPILGTVSNRWALTSCATMAIAGLAVIVPFAGRFASRVIYWLSLKNVCVDSPIYSSRGRSLKSTILAQTIGGGVADERDQNNVVIRAHVTLHLEHGALIGANLAGKTTLLRVMAKIFPPSRGVADVVGRIGCLTDLNVGMDPEATGYENIRMRGVLLGLTHQEIGKWTIGRNSPSLRERCPTGTSMLSRRPEEAFHPIFDILA